MLVFLLSSMFGVGLSLSPSQVIAPLRNVRFVGAVLAANFLIVPLVALGIAKLFRLGEPFAIGLLLLGLAPGAPFLPKLVEVTKGDLPLSVGLMALLMAGSVVFLPIVLPLLLPGTKVGVWQIARPLLFMMVLPLVCGQLLRATYRKCAAVLRPGVRWVSNLSLLTVTLLIVALNMPSVVKVFGTGAIGAGILFTALAGLVGHLLGGPVTTTRRVIVLGTGFRNIAAALLVGEEDFRDPQVSVMLVIAALAGLLLLLPVVVAWRKSVAVT
jgi:BASS family bile acid:Na+ symporter